MKLNSIILGLFVLFAIPLQAQNKNYCEDIAVQSVKWMQNDNSDSLYQHFTKDVSDRLDIENTRLIWGQISSQYGKFNKIDTVISKIYEETNLVIDCILEFKNGNLKYRLSFNKDNRIAGIFFIPYKTAKVNNREPQQNSSFIESRMHFTNDEIEFPALLCLPKNQETKSIVVLVHGSGPNDMNETIGPNKIFQQIAHELAKQGIGSLRYDKRTYIAQQSDKPISFPTDIQHIVVNDAVAAVEFISNIEGLNDLPIIIVGHSLGAHAAPLIASKTDKVKAIVLLAGNARPLEDLILEQYQYLYAKGGLSKAEKKEIKDIKKKVKNVKKLEKYLQREKKVDLPLTNDTTFWLSLNNYNAVNVAKTLSIPILILQGERDYQVTMADFDIWKNELQNNPKNKFISYPSLNHLFITGDGLSYPQEYQHQGDISRIMLSDMANWIVDNI